MMPSALWSAFEATWPAASTEALGPWLIREGRGGGKRVSSAQATGPWQEKEIADAENAMLRLGQTPLFRVRPDSDPALDAALAARGYGVVDPVIAYAAPTKLLSQPEPEPLSIFAHWPPLAICNILWAEGGIRGERLAIMERAARPKAALLARAEDRPVGAAFAAISGHVAGLHALCVPEKARRKGYGRLLLRGAAAWALQSGAEQLVLIVTAANLPARALYTSLGMEVVGQYHYRQAAGQNR